MKPASMAVTNVQAVVLADPMSSKPTDWIDDNSAITEFIVTQTMQLQIIEVLR